MGFLLANMFMRQVIIVLLTRVSLIIISFIKMLVLINNQ